ncbi:MULTISPECIES: maleylacetoacetate isomerase [unclassified Janthinobacterium]|uniref:maleylacetoacetate isomerase n=1 Tax=unclassified Janthinobacterium TaxID=2610881 RepID=UPI0003765E01|nr:MULTISPECIES: maleylacetoacetate isomerase [unclassified Janthinobacterium]MEC5162357.1 maleylacetoacetate isomerase [Janthinobacterium sp. CG_S6]
MLILHGYWLSLAAYRVRVALKLKDVAFEERMHDLSCGHQHESVFRALNPAGAVPALEGGTPEPLTQSLAILEWLEETYPTMPLLPPDAAGRARVRAMFLLTAADAHPLVVPRVQKRLATQFGASEAAGREWAAHWFTEGLAAYEALLSDGATRCHNEMLSLADLALASHLIGAERFGIDISTFPRVATVGALLFKLPEFESSHPRHQVGAVAT